MKHIDGLETSEIASITGSSEEAVRQNLSRARKRILKMFTR
jgi:RNA polymerase sigma-70 factor (ECF subfamily)